MDDFSILVAYVDKIGGKVKGLFQKILTNAGIEVTDVKLDEAKPFLVGDSLKPVDDCMCILPLVELCFHPHF